MSWTSLFNDFDVYQTINFIIANNEKANIICRDKYLKDNYLYYKNGHIESNFNIIKEKFNFIPYVVIIVVVFAIFFVQFFAQEYVVIFIFYAKIMINSLRFWWFLS